ncbi:Rnf-Nqr domain containing protein [Proteus columbae]
MISSAILVKNFVSSKFLGLCPFMGASISLITAGLMSLAFMGLSGLVKT